MIDPDLLYWLQWVGFYIGIGMLTAMLREDRKGRELSNGEYTATVLLWSVTFIVGLAMLLRGKRKGRRP